MFTKGVKKQLIVLAILATLLFGSVMTASAGIIWVCTPEGCIGMNTLVAPDRDGRDGGNLDLGLQIQGD